MDTAMVGAYRYRHEAEFARALLDSVGIGSVIVGDDAGGLRPEIMSVNPVRLYVAEEDAERATRALAEETDPQAGEDVDG